MLTNIFFKTLFLFQELNRSTFCFPVQETSLINRDIVESKLLKLTFSNEGSSSWSELNGNCLLIYIWAIVKQIAG